MPPNRYSIVYSVSYATLSLKTTGIFMPLQGLNLDCTLHRLVQAGLR